MLMRARRRDDEDEDAIEPRGLIAPYYMGAPSRPLATAHAAAPIGRRGTPVFKVPPAPDWSKRLFWNSPRPMQVADIGNDVAEVSMVVLERIVPATLGAQPPKDIIEAMRAIMHQVKPVVDATSGDAMANNLRKKILSIVIYRFWPTVLKPVKAALLQATFQHVMRVAMPPHVDTVLLAFDVCKRVETIAFRTTHLKRIDPTIHVRNALVEVVHTWEARLSRSWQGSVRALLKCAAKRRTDALTSVSSLAACMPPLGEEDCTTVLEYMQRLWPPPGRGAGEGDRRPV